MRGIAYPELSDWMSTDFPLGSLLVIERGVNSPRRLCRETIARKRCWALRIKVVRAVSKRSALPQAGLSSA
jgi:hypothetical protein